MKPIVKLIPKHNLFIVEADHSFALKAKESLEQKFGEEAVITIFPNAELSLEEIKKSSDKPHVLLIGHEQNKEILSEKREYAVSAIKRLSPKTSIVILADKKDIEQAKKALAHGAMGFVVKDQFAFAHILSAVKNGLHPESV